MLHRLLAFCLLTFCVMSLVGCSPTVKDKLAGNWKGKFIIDQTAIDKTKGDQSNPLAAFAMGEVLKQIQEFADVAAFILELKADGSMTFKLDAGQVQQSNSGKWDVKSIEGNRVVMVTTESQGEKERILVLDEDFLTGNGGFTWDAPELTQGFATIRFSRQ